jgi:hypothetical protein
MINQTSLGYFSVLMQKNCKQEFDRKRQAFFNGGHI